MYRIKEAVIVEGVYDKIKLSRFLDGVILATNGFSVFCKNGRLETIKRLAETTGIVILTDPDSAGFKIRNYIKQALPPEQVKHAYIPDIKGKEKRKLQPGKEGLLGVEGVSEEIILNALKAAGCEIDGSSTEAVSGRQITKADLYELGLSGGKDSSALRRRLAEELSLPAKLSANMLLAILNRLVTYEELREMAKQLNADNEEGHLHETDTSSEENKK